ncbi:MAG: TIGR03643 family protein [Marinobacter sp.]|nr:TIGR03643 family protein [Marinobacter sp.]
MHTTTGTDTNNEYNNTKGFTESDISRIIEMAWEDRTPFEAIEDTFGLDEKAVIRLMRKHLKPGSFRLWRKRVTGRKTKHKALRSPDVSRGYCPTQYKR